MRVETDREMALLLLLLLLVASLQAGSLQAAGLDLDSPQEQQLLAK